MNKDDFKALLLYLGFEEKDNVFTKNFKSGYCLSADFNKEELQYTEPEGLKINERQTYNFASAENAVVFECVSCWQKVTSLRLLNRRLGVQ